MNLHKIAISLLIITVSAAKAQESKTTLTQDSRFEKILNEKRRINSSLTVSENYQIQIYNGDSENAKKTLNNFKANYTDFDGTIVFNSPTYKVLVGNFKTRIDAERNFNEIRKTYKNALLIKPSK